MPVCMYANSNVFAIDHCCSLANIRAAQCLQVLMADDAWLRGEAWLHVFVCIHVRAVRRALIPSLCASVFVHACVCALVCARVRACAYSCMCARAHVCVVCSRVSAYVHAHAPHTSALLPACACMRCGRVHPCARFIYTCGRMHLFAASDSLCVWLPVHVCVEACGLPTVHKGFACISVHAYVCACRWM